MTYIRNRGVEQRTSLRKGRASGAVIMAALVGLSTLTPALAEPPSPGGLFAASTTPSTSTPLPRPIWR